MLIIIITTTTCFKIHIPQKKLSHVYDGLQVALGSSWCVFGYKGGADALPYGIEGNQRRAHAAAAAIRLLFCFFCDLKTTCGCLQPFASACSTSHITHHTSHITHHTSHITHHTSHITHHLAYSGTLLILGSSCLPAPPPTEVVTFGPQNPIMSVILNRIK